MRVLLLFLTLSLSLIFSPISQAKLTNGLYANLHTNQGDIIVKLAFEKTPLTVINFVGLAIGEKKSNQKIGKPFYDGLKFHRVIDNFMIQGGDPKGNGTGGPGYQFMDEITDLKHHKAGILSMANSGKNTNGSQFFITHNATPWLDGKHTVFGEVVKGLSVVNTIKKNDFIRKVEIIRIGDKAQQFQTDEAAFQTYSQQNSQQNSRKELAKHKKNQQKFMAFVKKNYPNAKAQTAGYYTQITQKGKGKPSKKGDLIKISLAIELDNGTVLRKADDKVIDITVGAGVLIQAIDAVASEMTANEKRTIIATYAQIYGDSQIKGVASDAIFIFKIQRLDK